MLLNYGKRIKEKKEEKKIYHKMVAQIYREYRIRDKIWEVMMLKLY